MNCEVTWLDWRRFTYRSGFPVQIGFNLPKFCVLRRPLTRASGPRARFALPLATHLRLEDLVISGADSLARGLAPMPGTRPPQFWTFGSAVDPLQSVENFVGHRCKHFLHNVHV